MNLSNITISNESLSFLQKHRNASMSQSRSLKSFVSFVHDSEDSDSDRSSVMLTPKLREHSRTIDRSNLENGGTPIKMNLSKRFTGPPSVTPSKIYQLAAEVSEEEENIRPNTTIRDVEFNKPRPRSKRPGVSKDYPKSPDYDMDAAVDAKRSAKTNDSPGVGIRGRRSKQLPTASEEESEETTKSRRRSASAKKSDKIQESPPKRQVKSPGRRSTKGTTSSIDMVIESVVRASPSRRSQSVSPAKSKQTNPDQSIKEPAKRGRRQKSRDPNDGTALNDTGATSAVVETDDNVASHPNHSRKQPVKRGRRPKSKDPNDRTTVNDTGTSGAVETDESVNVSRSDKRNAESKNSERRAKRRVLPTAASRLEFDWNYSSDDTALRTPKKGPRSTPKETIGPKSRTRSASRLVSQPDSTEDEANQSVSKSNGNPKTPPVVVDRPLVSKTPSKANPLSLLSASIYTASEDENTESTEMEAPSILTRDIRTPVRPIGKPSGDGIFTPNRSARKATVFVSPNTVADKQTSHAGAANLQTTPKSILKPSSADVAHASPLNFNHPPKSTVTTLTSLEIVSPVRTLAGRTEATMTSTLASFELITSPVRTTPVSSPSVTASHTSKSIMSAQSGVKRKSISTLPTALSIKRSRHQMNAKKSSQSMNRTLAIEPLENETQLPMEVERSTAVANEEFVPKVDPKRLNPYSAVVGDPLSTKQLLQSHEHRISYLELLPECFFSLRAHCRTAIVAVAGNVSIRCREPVMEKELDAVNRLVDLVPGSLYHLHNSGETVAHFQMIETLQSS